MLIHIIDAPAEESASARRRRERGKINFVFNIHYIYVVE